MTQRDIVVIGASAGSLKPLTAMMEELPAAFPACILITVHTSLDVDGVLPKILSRKSRLAAEFGRDGAPIAAGRVYVAKPGFQLMVRARGVSVLRGPRENGFRPAIDPLFRSAARAFGRRVIGVILSGALDDGVAGLAMIKQLGGVAVVQRPEDAQFGSMPRAAIERVDVDHIVPADELAPLLVDLCQTAKSTGERALEPTTDPDPQEPGQETTIGDMTALYGSPSALTCPDCGGALWELSHGHIERYRCHTGHQYTPDSLVAEQARAAEAALWSAVRVLEEKSELRKRMAMRADADGMKTVSESFADGAREAHEQANAIRALLVATESAPSVEGAPGRGHPEADVR